MFSTQTRITETGVIVSCNVDNNERIVLPTPPPRLQIQNELPPMNPSDFSGFVNFRFLL